MNARHLEPGDLTRSLPAYRDGPIISLTKVLPPSAVHQQRLPNRSSQTTVRSARKSRCGPRIISMKRFTSESPRGQEFSLRELIGAKLIGAIDSPIKGTDGNREFLIGLRRA